MGNGAVVAFFELGMHFNFPDETAALFKYLISPAALFPKVWSRD